MAVVDQLLLIFAQSIFAKAEALRLPALTSNQRKQLRSSIVAEIRACGRLLIPEVRSPEVSHAALEKARQLGVDLYKQTWQTQPSFDKRRKIFHWERVDPISCIQEKCETAESAQEVQEILRTRLRIAWILKDEDRQLTGRGSRSNRPVPDVAYRKAEIILIKHSDTGGGSGPSIAGARK